jgi:hypothetical protein
VLFTQLLSEFVIWEDERGWTCVGDKFWQNQNDRTRGRPVHRCEHNIKWILKEYDLRVWAGDIWEDRIKWRAVVNKVRTFCFHKIWGISSLAEEILVSQEGFCTMELVKEWKQW